MADAKETKDFTPREMEIMANAWLCMQEEPKVDYKKLAERLNMTNHKSAVNAWSAIKKKLMAMGGITKNGGEEGGTASPAKTPKSGSRAKRGKKVDEEGDDAEESPTKKMKPTLKGKKGKAVKSEPEVEKDEDEGDDKEGVVKQEEAADGE